MSRESIELYEQTNAIRRCEHILRELRLEIMAGPRRIIDLLLDLAEDQITRTGGRGDTARLRTELAACQAMLARRESDARAEARRAELRVVINSRGGVS